VSTGIAVRLITIVDKVTFDGRNLYLTLDVEIRVKRWLVLFTRRVPAVKH
jgi:hypothetical protein